MCAVEERRPRSVIIYACWMYLRKKIVWPLGPATAITQGRGQIAEEGERHWGLSLLNTGRPRTGLAGEFLGRFPRPLAQII